MAKRIYHLASLANIIMAAITTACGNTSITKTEKVDGVEWNVSLHKAVQFNDSLTGVSTCKALYGGKTQFRTSKRDS